MTFQISVDVMSHIGHVRSHNEDAIFVNGLVLQTHLPKSDDKLSRVYEGTSGLYCVLDGMGGEHGGEVASQHVVSRLASLCEELDAIPTDALPLDLHRKLNESLNTYNKELHTIALAKGYRRIGTTLVGLYIRDGRVYPFNIGDSRVYCLSKGSLKRISEDHNEAQLLLSLGVLTEETLMGHPSGNRLSRFIGDYTSEFAIEADTWESQSFDPEDVFLLSSDGFTDYVLDPELEALLVGYKDQGMNGSQIINHLVELALSRGGKDNITIMCLTRESEHIKGE